MLRAVSLSTKTSPPPRLFVDKESFEAEGNSREEGYWTDWSCRLSDIWWLYSNNIGIYIYMYKYIYIYICIYKYICIYLLLVRHFLFASARVMTSDDRQAWVSEEIMVNDCCGILTSLVISSCTSCYFTYIYICILLIDIWWYDDKCMPALITPLHHSRSWIRSCLILPYK